MDSDGDDAESVNLSLKEAENNEKSVPPKGLTLKLKLTSFPGGGSKSTVSNPGAGTTSLARKDAELPRAQQPTASATKASANAVTTARPAKGAPKALLSLQSAGDASSTKKRPKTVNTPADIPVDLEDDREGFQEPVSDDVEVAIDQAAREKFLFKHVEPMFTQSRSDPTTFVCCVPYVPHGANIRKKKHPASVKTNKGNSNLISHAMTWHPSVATKLRDFAKATGASASALANFLETELAQLRKSISNHSIDTMIKAQVVAQQQQIAQRASVVELNRIDLVVWSVHHGISFNSLSCPLWARINSRVGCEPKAFCTADTMSSRDIPLVYNMIIKDIAENLKTSKVSFFF